jgi:RNA polymerase sigma factor (sigma-70 family)
MISAASATPTVAGRPWDAVADDFAAWRAGDAAALDRVVTVLTPVLWQLARSYGLDRETAEDVVQTTWLALVRAGGAVRDPQAVWRWTTVTTRREAWRASRTGHREAVVEADALDAASPAVAGPEGEVLAGRRDRALWRQVGRLTERCRRLLRVIAFDDRPDYTTLSAELGIPVGSIGPTRGRCLDKLRGMLADDRDWADR